MDFNFPSVTKNLQINEAKISFSYDSLPQGVRRRNAGNNSSFVYKDWVVGGSMEATVNACRGKIEFQTITKLQFSVQVILMSRSWFCTFVKLSNVGYFVRNFTSKKGNRNCTTCPQTTSCHPATDDHSYEIKNLLFRCRTKIFVLNSNSFRIPKYNCRIWQYNLGPRGTR